MPRHSFSITERAPLHGGRSLDCGRMVVLLLVDSVQKQEVAGLVAVWATRTPVRKPPPPRPPSPSDGVALHSAGIGGGFEHRPLRGRFAGATGEATFRPGFADPQPVAALCQ